MYTANPPSLDWADKGFSRGLFVVILWGKKLISVILLAMHTKPIFSQNSLDRLYKTGCII